MIWRTVLLMFLFGIFCHTSCVFQAKKESVVQYSTLDTLGRYLFFDKRMSANNTKSCSSCHDPSFAFTDGYRQPTGLYGDPLRRNAPTLLNVSYLPMFDWANPQTTTLLAQMDRPLFHDDPPELGLIPGNMSAVLKRFTGDSLYKALFWRGFKVEPEKVDWSHIKLALEAYEKTLVGFQSAYDQYFIYGKKIMLDPRVFEGRNIFHDKKYDCAGCHKPPLFTDGALHRVDWLKNTDDLGAMEQTHLETDKYRFRTPTLRNISRTGPYFHNGSLADLNAVFDHFIQYGHGNSPRPIRLNKQERQSLILFLESLSDTITFQKKWFTDPWIP